MHLNDQDIQTLISLTEKYYRELDELIISSPNKSRWKCKLNCPSCCNGNINVTMSELLYIKEGIKNRINLELIRKLKNYIRLRSVHVGRRDHNIGCIFLEMKKCSIYSYRPSPCRKYFSLNQAKCLSNEDFKGFIDNYCIDKGGIILKKYRECLFFNGLPNTMVDFHLGLSTLINN